MKFGRIAGLVLALGAGAAWLWGQPAPATSSPLTLEGYRAELEQDARAVAQLADHPEQAPALKASLPAAWAVSTGGERFDVSTAWLRDGVANLSPDPGQRASQVRALEQQLQALRQGARDFAEPASYGDAHHQLSSILSRREFRGVGPPNWLDLWKRRVTLWLLRKLDSLFKAVGRYPGAGEVLVWVLILAAVALLGVVVVRALLRPASRPVFMPAPPAVARRGWADWLREARAAAQRREYRDALHRAYWAAIARCEEMGLWRPDRARTPREYLRLVPDQDPHRALLSSLTRRFEVTWYGYDDATASDFETALTQLERLGCREH